jgi:cardiolipin synthase C
MWHATAVRLRLRAALAAALSVLLALPAAADRVRILETDLEAIEARVEAVVTTERELLASAFVFGNDALTMTALAMLRDAARRGVDVRVIFDALWNKVPPPLLAHLRAEGVEIRQYHPFRWRHPSWLFRRLHDKLVIADGEVLVAGGRNVQSTYFGFGHQIEARNYVDIDLLVHGDAAAVARHYFLLLWESEGVRPLVPQASAAEIETASRELDRHQAWLDSRIEAARDDDDRHAAPLTEVGEVRFIHDPVDGGKAQRKVGAELREIVASARESLIIESPYLVPTRQMREAFRSAIARGVRIRILTNSLASTDSLLPQGAYTSEKALLVRSGIELWEYNGPESLHSKSAIIDERLVIVGSYNLDPRSENLNREIALVFRDDAVAAELRSRMDAHLANAQRIDARGYPEGSDEPFPGIPRRKVLVLRLLQIVAPLIRGQL